MTIMLTYANIVISVLFYVISTSKAVPLELTPHIILPQSGDPFNNFASYAEASQNEEGKNFDLTP